MFSYRKINGTTYAIFANEDDAASMVDVFAGMAWVCCGGYFNAFRVV